TLALTPLISLLSILTGLLLILGIAQGALDVGGNTLLVWLHREKVAPFMNALHFFFGLGAFLSPIIVARSLQLSKDINWAYWILVLLMIPIAIRLYFQSSPAAQTHDNEQGGRQLDYLLIGLITTFFFLYAGAEISFGGWIYSYVMKLNIT